MRGLALLGCGFIVRNETPTLSEVFVLTESKLLAVRTFKKR